MDYYKILNVSRTSDNKEINKAYKKLAKKEHPDITGKPATQNFIDIQNAYNILSNKKKRKKYDLEIKVAMSDSMFRDNSLDYLFGDSFFKSETGISDCVTDFRDQNLAYDPQNKLKSSGSDRIKDCNFESKIKDNKLKFKNSTESEDQNQKVILDVSIKEIYNNKKIFLNFNKQVICIDCNGKKISMYKYEKLRRIGYNFMCSKCKGLGSINIIHRYNHAQLEIPIECVQCEGNGYILRPEIICDTCYGLGMMNISGNIKLDLSKYLFINGSKYSNLVKGITIYINEISVEDHNFKRSINGKDLLYIYKISLYSALGCENSRSLTIKTLSENSDADFDSKSRDKSDTAAQRRFEKSEAKEAKSMSKSFSSKTFESDDSSLKDDKSSFLSESSFKYIIINIPDELIIKPYQVKKIMGKGMPLPFKKNSIKYGDLYILFNIIFPDKIDIKKPLISMGRFEKSTAKEAKGTFSRNLGSAQGLCSNFESKNNGTEAQQILNSKGKAYCESFSYDALETIEFKILNSKFL